MLTKKQELNNLLGCLQQAKQKRQSTVIMRKSFPCSPILNKLKSLGIVISFHEEATVVLIVLNLKSFSSIKTSNLVASLGDIKLAQKRKGGAFVSIINTDRGLLTSNSLLKHNVGGRSIVSIS